MTDTDKDDDARPSWLPLVDLRGVTRDSDKIRTIIEVKAPNGFFPWLRLGSLSSIGDRKTFINAYYVEGITDEEHHSAYALYFDIAALEFDSMHHGHIILRAWIAGAAEDAERFKVPSKSIMNLKEIEGTSCSLPDCEDGKHLIVRFTPPGDVALWKRLRGRELRITIAPVVEE